jgi:hypothetical protein
MCTTYYFDTKIVYKYEYFIFSLKIIILFRVTDAVTELKTLSKLTPLSFELLNTR